MKYSEMSDFEINKAVAEVRGYKPNETQRCIEELAERLRECSIPGAIAIEKIAYYGVDYCNNPSDAWPVIVDSCMSVELADPSLGGVGTCSIFSEYGGNWVYDFTDNDKALRAAMICYLEMKGDN